ncbi:MAG: linear amide C-N hydrolase [Ruminococcaceae bacterium]|nr:linear amide C-N hydrolase [Oscillospiraceae bacterium]
MKRKNVISLILMILLCLIVLLAVVFAIVYFTRFQTIGSIERLTDYEDGYDLYKIDIKYEYDLDRMMSRELRTDDDTADVILSEALPYLPIHMESPDYSCSAFGITDVNGDVLMGRNYDFDIDTSALLVYCSPKNGYKSVGMAALDHVGVHEVKSLVDKVCALPGPFICLDGMNEKGVSVSILMLDSDPVRQNEGRPDLFTTLAVRLILDRAATTQEAVDLLRGCDMYSVAQGDYHFFVTDLSGDGRVLEYDCESESRELIDTPVRTATNFYQIYIDKVLPDQYNGIYGHGRERYDRIEELLSANEGQYTREIAWSALEAAQQLPKPDEQTSNTQWSVVYNNHKRTAEITLRRKWGEITAYSLTDNAVTWKP